MCEGTVSGKSGAEWDRNASTFFRRGVFLWWGGRVVILMPFNPRCAHARGLFRARVGVSGLLSVIGPVANRQGGVPEGFHWGKRPNDRPGHSKPLLEGRGPVRLRDPSTPAVAHHGPRFLETSGNELVALAKILGHASLNTTASGACIGRAAIGRQRRAAGRERTSPSRSPPARRPASARSAAATTRGAGPSRTPAAPWMRHDARESVRPPRADDVRGGRACR